MSVVIKGGINKGQLACPIGFFDLWGWGIKGDIVND